MSNDINRDYDIQLIADLRDMAKNNATVTEMITDIQNRLAPHDNDWIRIVIYLRKAFGISIPEATSITGWNRFPYGELEADAINRIVMPAILKNRGFWDPDYNNSNGSSDPL